MITTGSDARKFWVKQESDSLLQKKAETVSRRSSATSGRLGSIVDKVENSYVNVIPYVT